MNVSLFCRKFFFAPVVVRYFGYMRRKKKKVNRKAYVLNFFQLIALCAAISIQSPVGNRKQGYIRVVAEMTCSNLHEAEIRSNNELENLLMRSGKCEL